ncbi:MAG: hypothetical protein RL386_364 [Bacteroidota bacterium]|jgi:hypothetical protein
MKQKLLMLLCLLPVFVLAQKIPGRDSRTDLREVDFSDLAGWALEKSSNFDLQNRKPLNRDKPSELTLLADRLDFDHPTPFVSFSATWQEQDDAPDNTRLFVATSADNTNWSPWQELTPDPHAVDIRYSFSSELLFFDKSTRYYRLKVVSNLLNKGVFTKKILLNCFSPGERLKESAPVQPAQSELYSSSSACPCPLPQFVSRQGWNCPQGATFPSITKVTHLIVHHSASANTSNDWGAVVLSFWNFHVNTNGWADIGYNWLVDPNGVLYEGRGGGENATGAHFCGKNGGTMGVCMIGTYTSTQASVAARKTLVEVLAWKACRDNINPAESLLHASSGLNLFRVSGHRDGCSTECPGEQLYRVLPEIRTAVQDRINACGLSTGVAPVLGLDYLRISPNPLPAGTPGLAEISLQRTAMLRYLVFDASGRRIASSAPQEISGKQQIYIPELSNFPTGTYSVQFWVDEQPISYKITIAK